MNISESFQFLNLSRLLYGINSYGINKYSRIVSVRTDEERSIYPPLILLSPSSASKKNVDSFMNNPIFTLIYSCFHRPFF